MIDALDALKQLSQEIKAERKKVKMTGRQAFNYIVLQAKHNYTGPYGYFASMDKIVVEGREIDLELHCVGHNASHEFYVGLLPDGRLITYSYCCANTPEDVAGFDVLGAEKSVQVQGTAEAVDFPNYLGHY